MKKEIINTTLATIGTAVTCLLGEWDKIIQILAILIIADYVTGIIKGYINRNLASDIGFKGILKKSLIFIVLILAHQLDVAVNPDTHLFRTMCVYFYIGNEGLSLLENLAILGVPLPTFLTDVLEKIQNQNNKIEVKANE